MHKDVWYYVDRQGQQRGPVTRAALIDAIHQEAVTPRTLVWRDGMAQWQPLSAVMGELEDTPPLPPAAPPAPPSFAQPAFEPARASEDIVYAGFARRGAAVLLDWLILSVLTFVVAVVLTLLMVIARGGVQPDLGMRAMLYTVSLVLSLLYFALQESSVHQATLGKRALGIKVTNYQGQRLRFAQAAGRWFAATLSYLTLMIGYLMAAFTLRKQAVHDMVASTLVVDRWAYTSEPQLQKRGSSPGLIVLIVVACSIFPLAIIAAIAVPAYQDFTIRAHVAQAMVIADPVKALVAKSYSATHHCPENGEGEIAAEHTYASGTVSSIRVGSLDEEGARCALEITLNLPQHAALDGKQIWLEMPASTKPGRDARWTCSSNMPDRYLPIMCRAPKAP